MSDLRAKITEALYEPPESQDGPFAGIAHRVAQERAQRRADAVMGVIEAEHGSQKCVRAMEVRLEELTNDLEAATHFLVGPYHIAQPRDQWEVWPDPALISLTGCPAPLRFLTLDEALATARRLADDA